MPDLSESVDIPPPPADSSTSSSPFKPNGPSRLNSSPSKSTSPTPDEEGSQQQSVVKSKTPSSSDMAYYYEKLLPFRHIFQWLNHSPKPQVDFTMREFAYEYRSGAYHRYNSYETLEDFKNAVVKANPTRFEVGAVYSVNPINRKTVPKSAMKPLEKELVFDIDLTDYDDIRTCCSKTAICIKCWQFITVATKILDKALRDDFGFENMIWVFSGRRGAHCWISDKRARILDESKRRAIVEYLDILKNKGSKRLALRRPYHPHVERSFQILKNEFIPLILENQDPWRDNYDELLAKLPNPKVNSALKDLWKSKPSRSSFDKWKDIDELTKKIGVKPLEQKIIVEAKQDIIMETLYPRLDVEVSRQMIHLLKSPFCIHPGTGNVCVPFDANIPFDPTTSPNLRQIQKEIEEWELENRNGSDRKISDYEKTSLKPYVELFGKFVNNLLKTEMGSVKREREDDLEY